MKEIDSHRGLWDLAVLCFLRECPMHPYEMQRLLLERHWDEVLVLKKGSLYHAIKRLLKSRLITAAGISRDGRRPERTTYRITPEGEQELVHWLREMVAVPLREPSTFMASINFLIHLTPSDAVAQLEKRAQQLDQEIATSEAVLKQVATFLPRFHLLEGDYLLSMRKAEQQWVRSLLDELSSGRLTWDLKKIFDDLEAARRGASTQAKGEQP
ncbi:MAG: helix-turn-helix transcriptional regulator [Acidobacteria bacterium]|nr:helix-turn-helix transcriptional regulator [Acidobacteriota bacterium]